MKFIFIIFVMAFVFSGCLKKQKEKVASPADYKELVTTASCSGKSSCLLIYVTPWCPACKQMSPLFKSWHESTRTNPEIGVKIIVGLEQSSGENKETADFYGDSALIDEKKFYHDLLKVQQYPTLLLIRNDGIVMMKDYEIIPWFQKKYPPVP